MIKDTYKTIAANSQGEIYKDKGSKFYGYIYKVQSEEEIKDYIAALKKEHHKARHWCYAYRIGASKPSFRANDDGEPSNSAGQPILGQIKSFELTNVLIVVVRYFGGTKLGVGGLISAYKAGAKLAIGASTIIQKTIDVYFKLKFNYEDLNKVMRVIKDYQLEVSSQTMEMSCEFIVFTRKSEADKIEQVFKDLRCLTIKRMA